MAVSRSLIGLLALVLVLGSGSAVASESPNEPQRDPADAANLAIAVVAIAAAQGQRAGSTWKGLDEATRSSVVRELDWAKSERERLAKKLRRDLAEVNGPDQACERDLLRQKHRAADALLAEYVSQLRFARGDRRSGLRKLESRLERHVLQPIGRIAKETVKASLPELVGIYLSGGTLSRALIRGVAKRHAQDLALQAITRKFYGVGAMSVDQAKEVCTDQAKPKVPPATTDGSPAIPPARYAGSFDEAELVDMLSFDGGKPETNDVWLVIDREGRVSGGFTVYQKGHFIGCPGEVADWEGILDPNQIVGPGLLQTLAGAMEDKSLEAYDAIEDECIVPPAPYDDVWPFDLEIQSASDGVITGVIADVLPFTVEWVAEP